MTRQRRFSVTSTPIVKLIPIPRMPFSLQGLKEVQGVANSQHQPGYYEFLVSRSWGDEYSEIFRLSFKNPQGDPHPGPELVYRGPAGVEALHFDERGGLLWTVFESGARHYQKRIHSNPWKKLYPFVFAIQP